MISILGLGILIMADNPRQASVCIALPIPSNETGTMYFKRYQKVFSDEYGIAKVHFMQQHVSALEEDFKASCALRIATFVSIGVVEKPLRSMNPRSATNDKERKIQKPCDNKSLKASMAVDSDDGTVQAWRDGSNEGPSCDTDPGKVLSG
jgi:hypothetical protein